jgi:hypothetical protein
LVLPPVTAGTLDALGDVDAVWTSVAVLVDVFVGPGPQAVVDEGTELTCRPAGQSARPLYCWVMQLMLLLDATS